MQGNPVRSSVCNSLKIRSAFAGLIFLLGMMGLHPVEVQAQMQPASTYEGITEIRVMPQSSFPAQSKPLLTPVGFSAANSAAHAPVPGRALLRSFVLPGWGQYYADSSDWRRGQLHLGADLLLLGSLIYLNTNAAIIHNNIYTYARTYAGIDLRSVPRNVELAVASSNSLAAYNQAQLRNRNWDRLIDDIPANRWQWQSEDNRGAFLQMRDRMDRAERQIPAVISLMVVNRVVSGVHAFIVARNQVEALERFEFGLGVPNISSDTGYEATVRIRF